MTTLCQRTLFAAALSFVLLGGSSAGALAQDKDKTPVPPTRHTIILGDERAKATDETDKKGEDADKPGEEAQKPKEEDRKAAAGADDKKADDKKADEMQAGGTNAGGTTAGGTNAGGKREDDTAKTADTPAKNDDTPAKADEPVEKAEEPVNEKELTIASWGGAYAKSQELAYFAPFTDETGIKITAKTHQGDLSSLNRRGEGDSPQWDVVDLSLDAAEKACNSGMLELIDPADLAPSGDGQPAKDDFLSDALQPCGVASMAWSSLIVYDKRAFTKEEPKSLQDFFDTKKFPGKRGMLKGPRYNLELALMADGVAPDKVYSTLQTDEGLARALEKLGSIRKDIVWWSKSEEPLKLLKKKSVVMATAYSGRTFFVVAGQGQPFGLIWDGQIYDLDLWAIPRSAKNKEGARKFIAFATKPERLAAQTKWYPYGPTRKSAVPLIGAHAEVGIDMAPYVPTASDNFKTALALDVIWWERQQERIAKRFAAWMAAKPENAQKDKKVRKIRPKVRKKKP